MHENIFRIYQNRIEKFLEHIEPDIYPETVPLRATVATTSEPVSFQDKETLPFSHIKTGDVWGHEWESAWFHLSVTVPLHFEGKELCLRIHTGGESLLFDEFGTPIYGLTGCSIFAVNYYKDRFLIGKRHSGEKLSYWLEAVANAISGVVLEKPHELKVLNPKGRFTADVKRLELSVFDRTLWSMVLDFRVLNSMLGAFGREDYRGAQLLHILNGALDLYKNNPANAEEVRSFLAGKALSKEASSTALRVCAIGHAHLDIGYLWPVRESIRKAARTFSSQLSLMEKYPDYIFGASQAALYHMVKANYPALYENIRYRVSEGRWEVQGGMWVEADCNLISGESMVRQFLHGKNFFKDEFGVNVKNLWLPDVFGYSGSMPQIMKKSGCDYFLTQKISWSQINKFPHNTFRWRGIDGTEVITHFPPENSYNESSDPARRIKAQNSFKENGYLDEFMSLFGIGDGGGGPTEEYVERELRMRALAGCPKSVFSRADSFFERLAKYEKKLPVWAGELYLEFHRGTLTSQARTKRGNRQCEQSLAALEFLASCLPLEEYPGKMLDHAWKTLLLNQFHDIIPGSSIHAVYEQTEEEHKEILLRTREEMDHTAAKLFRKANDSCVLVNTLSGEWSGLIAFPETWKNHAVTGPDGISCPAQEINGEYLVFVQLPAGSFTTFIKGKKDICHTKDLTTSVLENEWIRYEFSSEGELLSAYDKKLKREIMSAPGNILSLYRDEPLQYEAWDIEIFYKRDHIMDLKGKWISGKQGAACAYLDFEYHTEKSVLHQHIRLTPGSRRLDFVTRVEWQESRKLLRTAFPVTIISDTASFDIPYGIIRRSTADNTSWDEAQFEVCGQKYADLSEPDYGAALLNDCKYGYRVKDSSLELSLLRAPKYPDCIADMGHHEFTYSFLPHPGVFERYVLKEADNLNRNPYIADGYRSQSEAVPPCHIESESVSLETVKKAEMEDSLVLRLVEKAGCHSQVRLFLTNPCAKLSETDLMEWKHGEEIPVVDGVAQLSIVPFEIRTLRLVYKTQKA